MKKTGSMLNEISIDNSSTLFVQTQNATQRIQVAFPDGRTLNLTVALGADDATVTVVADAHKNTFLMARDINDTVMPLATAAFRTRGEFGYVTVPEKPLFARAVVVHGRPDESP